MADGDESSAQPASEESSSSPLPLSFPDSQPSNLPESSTKPTTSQPEQIDRTELLSRARSFLVSPQVQQQDTISKHRFLSEKGLTEPEIDGLLGELAQRPPLVPPRAYPQPPPSNLPNLLIGLFRLFAWLASGSTFLIFIYYRFLLPRLVRSQFARSSLKSHHLYLLRKLSTSLASLKEAQAESYSVLPSPQRFTEDLKYSVCHGIHEILAAYVNGQENKQMTEEVDVRDLPKISLLRCAIEEFMREKEGAKPSSEDLLKILGGQIPWLRTDRGVVYQNELLQTLSTCPLFLYSKDTKEPTSAWTYIYPSPPQPSPLLLSLTNLSTSLLAKKSQEEQSRHWYQETLQTLLSFTGYLAKQLYSLPNALPFGASVALHPAEEELRREIRGLKGLVLNRKYFMPMANPENTPPKTLPAVTSF